MNCKRCGSDDVLTERKPQGMNVFITNHVCPRCGNDDFYVVKEEAR